MPALRCRLEGVCSSSGWEEDLENSDYSVKLHCLALEQDIAANVIAVMVLVEVGCVCQLLLSLFSFF